MNCIVPMVTAVLMLMPVPVAAPKVAVEDAPEAAAPVLHLEPVSHAPLLVAVHVAFAACASAGQHNRMACRIAEGRRARPKPVASDCFKRSPRGVFCRP